MVSKQDLINRQNMPLSLKVRMTEQRIKDYYEHYNGNVYVSFSGGKDSTVLLDIARNIYPDIEAVFIDTGLEYPEIKTFVNTFKNVTIIKPKQSFLQVITKHGYPIISKNISRRLEDAQRGRTQVKDSIFKLSDKYKYLINSGYKFSDYCCTALKKLPIRNYELKSNKHAIVGTMASDSQQREKQYLKIGCTSFGKKGLCIPLGFWREQDIWDYIKQKKISYCSIYDMGIKRTGCMFCMFGCMKEKSPNRFELMAKTHPKIYNYCINKLGMGKILKLLNVKYKLTNKEVSKSYKLTKEEKEEIKKYNEELDEEEDEYDDEM